jgi:rod shape-determining protein MreD
MNQKTSWPLIIASFIGAIILTLLPMPEWTVWLRPAWVLMVVIYWIIMAPNYVNVGAAWFVGLILDLLNGSLLGEHALAMLSVAYIVSRIYLRIRMFPFIQQSLTVFLLVLFYQGILFCIQGFIGDLPASSLFWASALTSMILWPWLFSLLRNCQRKFSVV